VQHNNFPKIRRFLLKSGVGLALLCSLSALAQTSRMMGRRFLHGHVPAVVSHLQAISQLPVQKQMPLAIGLPLRNTGALSNLLQQIYDPASTNYHHYLTPGEFTKQFGPTPEDYQSVIDFAKTNGFIVAKTYSNRLLVDVRGSVANINKAFHITMQIYEHPNGKHTFFSPDVEPSVDASVPILDISGLNNYEPPHPQLIKREPLALGATPRGTGSGSGGAYMGYDFRKAYLPGVTLDGSGQMVGLLEFDGYYASDITSYEQKAGLPDVPLQNVLLDGFSGTPTSDANAVTEVSLDIEMAISMAPGLSRVVVFEGSPINFIPNDVLNSMAANDQIKQLSSSWGWGGGPSATTDNILKQFAAQGQSFFDASGDNDAYTSTIDSSSGSTEPADSPYVTAVGGTTLTTTGPGGSWSSETVWNWGGGEGSSGGISTYYSIPSWQTNIDMTACQGSTTKRNIPDVALTADNIYVVDNDGESDTVGGTSAATPLWAAFTALVNQQATAAGRQPVGFLNPALYAIGSSTNFTSNFHDITTGNNTSSASPNLFYAVPGYDLCTGLGTPAGQNLINSLAGPPDEMRISPPSGFSATGPVGGSFDVTSQTFSLTNLETSSLDWTLASTSAWLNVSSTNGTLLPGAPAAQVTVSLNSLAGNLVAGVYQATIWFTNLTSGVGQSREFTLQVLQPLVITPTNGFTSLGGVGGPFNVTSQDFSLTNISGISLDWSVISTSLWLEVTPAGGTLEPGGTGTVTVNLAPAATNLAAGIYDATVWFTNQTTGGAVSNVFALRVGQPLVQNGGFETGDFTDWTLTGDGGDYDYVDDGVYITPHSGDYAAALGEVGTLAYLSQTLPTSPGQTYLLSLWLDSPNVRHQTLTPNEFTVEWNGVTLFDQTDIGKIGWTNLQFTVKATSSSSVLQIGARDDNYYLGLDDVSVTPILSPLSPSLTAQPTNLIVQAGNNAVFHAQVNGSAPLVYQWLKNNASITDGGNVSGANGNVLTLSSVTAQDDGNYRLVVTNSYGSVTSSVVSLTVNLNTASVALTSPVNPSGYRDNVDFVANVNPTTAGGTPTTTAGTVQFFTNGTAFDTESLANGQATSMSIASLPRGTNLITAIYSGDADYLPATNTFAQIVTNHPPTAATVYFTRLAGFPLDIPIASLATNWSDVDGDALSLAGVSVSTNGITLTNNAGTLVYSNPNNVPDQFVCTISDGWGGTNFQTVNIAVVNPVPSITSVAGNSDGSFTLNLSGLPNYTYILETTTNLLPSADWLPIATNTFGADGVWQFNDTQATNYTQRFYRLKLAQ
jgi:Pro-kumamolisin, activation domain/Immunoglobulin I-set domain/Bacterial Ig-like domain (group 3)/Viral BACON domain